MKFSSRILEIKPSPTLAITALANSMKIQGINILDFSSGEPDFDTPQFIKDAAINAINEGKTKYTLVGGIPQLKEAVVSKLKRDNNLDYNINEVTINCGGKHSFYNLMQVLFNEGDEVIVLAPYWVSYPSMISLAGAKPVILPTTESTQFKITPEMLDNAINSNTRAVIINSPSNPTGSAYTEKELFNLAEIFKKHNIFILSDDIYEKILYDNFKHHNIAELVPELKPKTIIINAVSKTYSMTGWRIGYIAANKEIIKHVETLQSQSTSNPTSISQYAAIAALTGDQTVLNDMISAFSKRRDMIVNGLNEVLNFSCQKPNGAFYAFPSIKDIYSLPGWTKIEQEYNDKSNSSKLSSYLLKEAQVAVVPGIAFGIEDYIRLSFATSDDKIIEGIKRIKNAINALQ